MTAATLTLGERLRAATTATALAACLAIGAVSNVHADTVPTARVSYADLNLDSTQGSQKLYARIVSAARTVCAINDIHDVSSLATAYACRDAAIARAVHEVNSPTLASIYEAQLRRHG